MNVGIFNRWLPTMGGGERHSLAIASHLAQNHNVEVISHTPIHAEAIAGALGLNLSNVRFRAVPQRPPVELGPFVSRYDLFINASHADFVPPTARHNVMLVFFPVPLPLQRRQRLRRFLAQRVIRLGMQPRLVDGVFGLQEIGGLGSHGLDRRAKIMLPASAYQPYQVHLSLASAAPTVTSAELMLDGESIGRVDFERMEQFKPVTLTISPGADRVLAIRAIGGETLDTNVQPYLRITPLRIDTTRASAYHRLFHQRWPEVGVRLQNIMPANLTEIVRGYDLLWANSRYTQRWIDAYWDLPSTVLYPPVAIDQFPPGSKGRRILSVGRFFAGNHNKKHLDMIYAFRRLLEDGLTGWELHLAGGVTPGQRHEDYALEVHAAAQGSPIYIHADLPQSELGPALRNERHLLACRRLRRIAHQRTRPLRTLRHLGRGGDGGRLRARRRRPGRADRAGAPRTRRLSMVH